MASKNRIGMQDADGYVTWVPDEKMDQWKAWQKLTPEEKAQQSKPLRDALMQRVLADKNGK